MIELVVFDWDGTLMDSRARIVHAMREAFAAHGRVAPPAGAIQAVIGLALPDAVARIAPTLDEPECLAVAAAYRDAFRQAAAIPSPLYPEAATVLAALAERGLRLAVATGKSRAGLDRALAECGLARAFAATRTADECAPKPAPDMLLELLAETGVRPAAALMVGDTTFDLEMAAAAGVRAVAITHGAHDRATLAASAPVRIIDALDELPTTLAVLTAPSPVTQEDTA